MDVAQYLLLHRIHLLGAVGLVAPVSRQSPLRHLMHLTGAYLHLNPLSRRTHHGDVERPVAIGLRVSEPVTRAVILEGKVGCEHVVDPEAVGILRAIRLRLKDDTYRKDVIDLLQRQTLGLHFIPDRVGALDPVLYLVSKPRFIEIRLDDLVKLVEESLPPRIGL